MRRLRENASFLVEGGRRRTVSRHPAERAATAVAARKPEEAAAAAAAATRPTRRRPSAEPSSPARRPSAAGASSGAAGAAANGGGGSGPAWLLGAGSCVHGDRDRSRSLLSRGSPSASPGSSAAAERARRLPDNDKGPCPPGQTEVAVLNGTATARARGDLRRTARSRRATRRPRSATRTRRSRPAWSCTTRRPGQSARV